MIFYSIEIPFGTATYLMGKNDLYIFNLIPFKIALLAILVYQSQNKGTKFKLD